MAPKHIDDFDTEIQPEELFNPDHEDIDFNEPQGIQEIYDGGDDLPF